MSWPSLPASVSAHGSTNSGVGHRLARARYAHTINAVFDAELWVSTSPVYQAPTANTTGRLRPRRYFLLSRCSIRLL